jgi:hypothetical protein
VSDGHQNRIHALKPSGTENYKRSDSPEERYLERFDKVCWKSCGMTAITAMIEPGLLQSMNIDQYDAK